MVVAGQQCIHGLIDWDGMFALMHVLHIIALSAWFSISRHLNLCLQVLYDKAFCQRQQLIAASSFEFEL